jgi:SH3 domain-containing protein
MKVQPLKTEAKWLLPKPSTSRSGASAPDVATLVERFPEPLRGPTTSAAEPLFAVIRLPGYGAAQSPAPEPEGVPAAAKKSALPIRGLISALVGIALVPTAILFVLLWQDAMRMRGGHEGAPVEKSAARLPDSTGAVQPEQASTSLEVALSSPDRIEANAGEAAEFPIAIDATETLPARSIVTVTALPEGASFSAGRPFGDSGWSLRPDEIDGLALQLPAQSGASQLRLELIAGDGTVMAQSETQVSIAPVPAEVAAVASLESNPVEQVAPAEQPASVVPPSEADAPPLPERKPTSPVTEAPAVKVTKVKVVTIEPPRPTRPHDGAYALGSPADAAQAPGEWMETKTAVDMHAKAEQSSETVKVAEGGVKMRVTARDKNWVQVTDPKSSTTGWIYNRFLRPADPAAQ